MLCPMIKHKTCNIVILCEEVMLVVGRIGYEPPHVGENIPVCKWAAVWGLLVIGVCSVGQPAE